MKFVTVVIVIISISSNSQILFDENFDYPAGDSIGAHGWTWNTGNTNPIFVAAPGLSFSGYPLSGIGNHCHLRNNGYDAYKGFTADSIGGIYAAFIVKLDSVKFGGDYFFAFLPSSSTANYTARFYAKDSSGHVSFGISKNTSVTNPVVWTPNTYALSTTYLVIIKYIFNTGSTTDDAMKVFIYSSSIPETEPVIPTIGPVTGPSTDLGNLGRVALRQGTSTTSPTLNIDGIRVFKSWSNIIGIVNISTIAERFSLSQNFPNPFNPITKIRFSIPERGDVKLKVFDMLGKEVSDLIDGNLITGTYEADFKGNKLSSGTYIYRLSFTNVTGKNFNDAKKMVLVK